ncbi:hypothetical protein [Pseudaeromonas paramecii]|uniref:Uncharacterized protein n=1 Tax=Pseudaeromonas paramecii TaxID=2138166 RepID=A0ABP8PWW2_9GAMM
MDLSVIQKELKSALYERLNSPFIGCFILSWMIINYKSLLLLAFLDDDIATKISMIEDLHENTTQFLIKPLALSVAFIITHPIISVLIFWWQERLRDLKRHIKLNIENAATIPMREYRKLEAHTSEKLAKHNEMVLVYEGKIEKISAKAEQFFNEKKGLAKQVDDLRIRLVDFEDLQARFAQMKEELTAQRLTNDNLKNDLKKLTRINESNEETASMLSKQFEAVQKFHKTNGFDVQDKMVTIDIPHLGEHSINRLTHEIKSLGIAPTFDGDAKAISLAIPFYIDCAHLEVLADKYRSDISVVS